MIRPNNIPLLIGFFALTAGVAFAVFTWTYRVSLEQTEQTADARLAQYNDRFLGQISRFQQLVNSLSRHPQIAAAVDGSQSDEISDLLLSFALSNGADQVFLVNNDGRLAAISDQSAAAYRQIGTVLRKVDFIDIALNGGLGWSHGLEDGIDPRKLYFSRAIFSEDGPVLGAIALSVSVASLEFEWSFSEETVVYFDQGGIVFVTNRPELALLKDPKFTAQAGRPIAYETDQLTQELVYARKDVFGHTVWELGAHDVLPNTAFVLSRYIPRVEMEGRIFLDVSPIRRQALIRAMLSAAIMTAVGLALLVARLRRRALAAQLQVEAAANEALEARVDARTQELREAQDQLIAASRLTALGEMSAGISHELNQPLAAMQNYAENGTKLLAKGRPDAASDNFVKLGQQVERMGRIIRSLRAFARDEPQDISAVSFNEAIASVLEVSRMRLNREDVTVMQHLGDAPVYVSAGSVRLEQVLLNIIGNAIDAMEGCAEKSITLHLSTTGTSARLDISDTGPGIAAPESVFEPFYSTKEQGASKGMGLGLSISHGIIGSFAGTLTCTNRSPTGAVFSITLPLAKRSHDESERPAQ